jgi:hypothetical protein
MSFTDWCAQQIVRPLDLDRPLWRAEVVCGLPAARFGVLIVVHHAVADGLTGVALAASLMDAGPRTGSPPVPAPGPAAPSPAPAPAAPLPQHPAGRLRQRWR